MKIPAVVALLVGWLAVPAHAAVIEFEAVDEADVVAGDDLWSYRYFVSGFAFAANQGFSVFFAPAFYRDLQDPPAPVSPSWDLLVAQPDAVLPSDGFYDALALAPGASLADPFTLRFVWLGGPGGPGSQAFTVNALDANGGLAILESGRTTPRGGSVPEPLVWLLMASGLLPALARRRSRPDL
jgi:hypothetical protein